MYAIILDYTTGLDEIDQALPDHVAWLDEHYAAGHFLASGRREPRAGGVILATDMAVGELEQIVAADPFAARGLARHTVVRFHPSKTIPELAAHATLLA